MKKDKSKGSLTTSGIFKKGFGFLVLIAIVYALGLMILNSLVTNDNYEVMRESIQNSKIYCVMVRLFGYTCLYLSWPWLIKRKLNGRKQTDSEYQYAMSFRNRILVWLVIIEVVILLS